jgi:penicillin-binding protein 2
MDENVKKFKIFRNIILIAFAIVILSGIKLQLVEGKKYYRLSEENRIKQRQIPAPRGRIFDRNGIEIANTRPGLYVSIVQALTDENTLQNLSHILNMDRQTMMEKCKLEQNPFMAVKIAHDIPFEQLSVIEEHMDELKGVDVGVEPLRNYPYGNLMCHLVGYVGEVTDKEIEQNGDYSINDWIGRMGLEAFYEDDLRGKEGIEYVEVDARGREVGIVSEKRPTPVIYGKDLHTTIDIALAESVSVYLQQYAKAACVCMQPQTGEIFVLYSKPGFNPNGFVHGFKKAEWDELNNSPDAPMYNRAIMSLYPAGSAFKPFVALAALDAKMVTEDKTFSPCEGQYRLGRRIFRCWETHGRLTLYRAIVHSCDIYFYQLGRYIGIDTLISRVSHMGFGRKTNIDLPMEKAGLLPDRSWYEKQYGKNWTDGHIFNLSIGQGDLLVTPLQLACAYTVFANNGAIVTPYVVTKPTSPRDTILISAEALATVKKALRAVVTTGTGQLANVRGYEISGKTGTAQNPHGSDHSIFVGYEPVDEPDILVVVIVENAGHGGSIAAPIAGKIIRAYRLLMDSRNHAKKT